MAESSRLDWNGRFPALPPSAAPAPHATPAGHAAARSRPRPARAAPGQGRGSYGEPGASRIGGTTVGNGTGRNDEHRRRGRRLRAQTAQTAEPTVRALVVAWLLSDDLSATLRWEVAAPARLIGRRFGRAWDRRPRYTAAWN